MIFKWVLVLLVFSGTDVVDSRIGGAKTEAECRERQKEIAEQAKGMNVEAWTVCIPLTHVPKKVEPKPDRVN